jgi:hypothetical protein
MATVVKDFKVKAGLVVEGSTGTINGKNILREDDSDEYILDLIGGETLIKSVDTADFKVTVAGELEIEAGSDLARTGDITNAINALTTADIEEGVTNQYFTTARVDSHLSGGSGITYSAGEISADLVSSGGLGITISGQLQVDRTTTDTWYDAAGAASDVATDLSTHENDTSAHGVSGDIVGTTDTQTLSGKSISGNLNIKNQDNTTIGSISAYDTTMYFNAGNGKDVQIAGQNIVLYGDGGSAYIGSASPENEIATHDYVDTAEQDAKDYTDLLLGDATIDGSGGNTVTDRIATAVADLVDGAPALLDTLNELAAAIGDNVDAEGLAVAIGNKLPLAGGTLTGALAMGTNKITGLGTPTADADAATKKYVDDQTTTDVAEGTNLYFTNQRALDATSAAYEVADAVSDHNALTTGVHGVTGDVVGTSDTQTLFSKTIGGDLNFGIFGDKISSSMGGFVVTGAGSQIAVEATTGRVVLSGDQGVHIGSYDQSGVNLVATQGYVDALDTDDIEEGSTNQYYTKARAEADAGALIANATKSNIEITYTGGVLSISAENGVADSDTDDLTEGTTNLYFTDERAVDALEAVVPNFTAVEVNSLAKQIAATVSAPTGGSQVTAYEFAKADYRSAKFLVKTAYATHTELSEVLITLDTSDNIAITEYATVGTNGSSMTITADIYGPLNDNVRLRVTPTNNSSTITVVGTLLA